MNNAKIYNTKQKSIIKEFFLKNSNNHFTAEQLLSILVFEKKLVSKATLYRTLDAMISSGEIIKYKFDSNTSCYKCRESDDSILFKCNNCGKILQIENKLITKTTNKINSEYGINIDSYRTVLYGTCQECKGGN